MALLKKEVMKFEGIRATHLEVANAAQRNYRDGGFEAREKYVAATDAWNKLRQKHADGLVTDDDMKAAAKYFARLKFVMESDYQMDKFFPYWGASPQPGPTYFMSHNTCYVHIIVSQSLGDAVDTNFGRNIAYTRDQCLTDERLSKSKDSNDTASTIFHFLSGAESTGYEPSVFRRGYGPDGPEL